MGNLNDKLLAVVDTYEDEAPRARAAMISSQVNKRGHVSTNTHEWPGSAIISVIVILHCPTIERLFKYQKENQLLNMWYFFLFHVYSV